MGLRSLLNRSRDDLKKPKSKSYWGYQLSMKTVNVKDLSKKANLLPSERRALLHELTETEKTEKVLILRNKNKKLGRFTTSQIKEMLDDIGFNIDTVLGKKHNADLCAVMSIKGTLIPGWRRLKRYLVKRFPFVDKLLSTKFMPGKERLHLRLYEGNDGSWMVTAHTEYNWLSLKLIKAFKSHVLGDVNYKKGALMAFDLFEEFNKYLSKNKIFSPKQVVRTIRKAYYKDFNNRFKKAFKFAQSKK